MAAETKEIVRFGLKNAHYSVWDDKTKKYGAPVAVPGSISLSISPEGDSSTLYCDDRAYFVTSANGGYSGTLEVAAVPDQMLIDLLGYVKDANGMIVEDSDAVAKTFALLYEVDSNIEPVRFTFFNCTLTRPSGDSNTKGESIDPDTQSLEFKAVTRSLPYGDSTIGAVKGFLPLTDETKDKYDAYFDEVMLPTKAAA